MLRTILPGCVCDIVYPADEDGALPSGAGLDAYDGIAWTGSSLTAYHDDPQVTRQIELARARSRDAGLDSLLIANDTSPLHSLRIIYFTEIVGGSLTSEVDGSTDLCAWHTISDVSSLPIVNLVEAGLRLVES